MSALVRTISGLLGVPDFDPHETSDFEKVYNPNLYHPVFGERGIVENPRLNVRSNYVPVKPDNGIGPEFLASDWKNHPLIDTHYKVNYLARKAEYMDEVTSDPKRQLDPETYLQRRSGRFFTNYGTGERRHTLTPNEVAVNDPMGFIRGKR